MADLVVGLAKSVVDVALTKAQTAIEEESKLRQSAQRDLVFITGEFQMMQSFLNVADEERIRNDVVRTWVRQVRDLAYDVDDLIEFVIHLDKKSDWWCRFLPRCIVPALPLDEVVAELKQLKERVEDVSHRNMRYNLITDSGSKPVTQQQVVPGAAAGATTFDMLIAATDTTKMRQGLGDLTRLITKKADHLGVISVWGTGGDLGTTSIIREIYGDPEVCENFGCRGWAKLAHPFNPHEFLQSLLTQFYTNPCLQKETSVHVNQLKRLQAAAQGELVEDFMKQVDGRYLVILENVSTMVEWDTVRAYLPDRKNGSCIIVSTQQCEIASSCVGHTYQVMELMQYSTEHSVCVFFKEGSQGDGVKSEETHRIITSNNEISTEDEELRDYLANNPLVGRKSQMKELRDYLAKALINDLPVMSVWGIAGVGKSALVRNLYNTKLLDKKHQSFYKYGWVNVSHPFNLRDFSRSLLLEFQSGSAQHIGIKDPIQGCRKFLNNHRCLAVIDDLHSKEEWDFIQHNLISTHTKSIIIVITTEASVATHCAYSEEAVFNVKGLEAKEACDLFQAEVHKKKASSPLIGSEDVEVRELILKCGGLPKVIVAIADFLAPKIFRWMDSVSSINQRFMHELETKHEFGVLQGIFRWMHSYFRTCPDFLKPCIFYLSIFPQDHIIRRRRLVRRWIAEGYARDTDNSSAEERGEQFFSRLLDLSIIQPQTHSVTTASYDTRMVLCQVNSFFRQYIISRQMEEQLVFELAGSCSLTTQRTGRHLIILESWDRDEVVFESIDFSLLRSLTVSGEWRKFFISISMKVLRVLDLENASGVTDKDLEKIVKLLPRLKFLSLRGRSEICHLPSSLGYLRQLETLDVRHTSVVTLPASITKLKKLQYIRAGTTAPAEDPSRPCSLVSLLFDLCRCHQLVGVAVPCGTGKLTALHTFGVINVSDARGKAILKELRNLTQLRKLGVSGVCKENRNEFCSAISGHSHLESLSVWLNEENQEFLDGIPNNFSPPKNLKSLKLYGLVNKLPVWINLLGNLRKLELEITIAAKVDITVLEELQELCILRLCVKPLQNGKLDFCVVREGQEDRSYEKIKVLEIACSSKLLVTFGSKAMPNLELLTACCSSGSTLQFDELKNLRKLREVWLMGPQNDSLKEHLKEQLKDHPNRPATNFE